MLSIGEMRSMNDALQAHAIYVAALKVEASKVVAIFDDNYLRALQIVEEAEANQSRFIARRNELIEMDPSDHEAVLLFVEGIHRIARSPLPALMEKEAKANNPINIVGGAIADTASDIAEGIKIGLPTLAIAAIALAFILRR